MIVIGDMLGVAPEDRAALLGWSDDMLGSLNGGSERMEAAGAAFGDFFAYAQGMIAARPSWIASVVSRRSEEVRPR